VPGAGRSVFARADVPHGSTVLREQPRVCSLGADDVEHVRNVAHSCTLLPCMQPHANGRVLLDDPSTVELCFLVAGVLSLRAQPGPGRPAQAPGALVLLRRLP